MIYHDGKKIVLDECFAQYVENSLAISEIRLSKYWCQFFHNRRLQIKAIGKLNPIKV